MTPRYSGLAPLLLSSALTACAAPERTTDLTRIDQNQGYRYTVIEERAPKALQDTFIVMTFSGGGTRAAALSFGALEALAATTVPVEGRPTPLIQEIDLISSVSGGSVTAAYFALKGPPGFGELKEKFLLQDVRGALITTAVNPITWARLATPSYARIDVLRDYFEDHLFEHAKYRDLLDAEGRGPAHRPYVVLNAADMATGTSFAFIQDQFDLICSDLAEFKLSDAVAASAAFPVALTALTLKNRAGQHGLPCKAHTDAMADSTSGWVNDDGKPRPRRVVNDLRTRQSLNPARHRRGMLELSYLNEDGQKEYVQLLDGGVADNLGLSVPLRYMTSGDLAPSILNRIQNGSVKRALVIVVNARSESSNDFGKRSTPPGLIDTVWTTIGSPIDGTSFLLLDRLEEVTASKSHRLSHYSLVPVDFDYIDDPRCRHAFKNIQTNWTLPRSEVEALIALGDAMVRDSGSFKAMIEALGGTVPLPLNSIGQVCAELLGAS